jgi:enterochelin esterase-like enzyme
MESHELNIRSRTETSAKFDVYLPAGYEKSGQRYPLILILGGAQAQTEGLLPNILDNLIATSIHPVIAVFVADNNYGSKPPDYPDVVDIDSKITVQEILPFIERNYRTIPDVDSRAIMGAGFGGYMALYTAVKNPDVFGNVAIQSLEMLDLDLVRVEKEIQSDSKQPLRIYHDWGLYDLRATREGWDMRKMNEDFDAFLRERGYKPAGGENHEAYGWASWRNRTDRWLSSFFPISQ